MIIYFVPTWTKERKFMLNKTIIPLGIKYFLSEGEI
jgi:hypothetical protein